MRSASSSINSFILLAVVLLLCSCQEQFTIKTSDLYGELSDHGTSCSLSFSELITINCADSYSYLQLFSDFINQKQDSTSITIFSSVIVDDSQRNGDQASFVINEGQLLISYKFDEGSSQYEKKQFKLEDSSIKLLSGFENDNLLLLHLMREDGTFYLQVHQPKSDGTYHLITVIDSDVVSYDFAEIDSYFYIYATKQKDDERYLVMKEYDTASPKDQQVTYRVANCGDLIKATTSLVVMACFETTNNKGQVSVHRLSDMELLGSHTGVSEEDFFGQNLKVIELLESFHYLILATVNSTTPDSIFYFEVLGDIESDDSDIFFGDLTKLVVNPGNNINFGDIQLQADKFHPQVLYLYSTFDTIYGHTFCNYEQYVSGNQCLTCPSEQFSISPVATSCVYLSEDYGNSEVKERMQIVQNLKDGSLGIISILAIAVVMSGIFIISIAGVILCKQKRVCCFQPYRPIREEAPININDLTEEQRNDIIKKYNQKTVRLLKEKIKIVKYSQLSQKKNNATNCCICFEEFNKNSVVRETECKHLFHDHCLMQWIETKIEEQEPDCPFCRTELKV